MTPTGALDIADIAERLDASLPSVLSMLRAAEGEGMVRSKYDPVTKRTLYFALCDFSLLSNGELVRIPPGDFL